MKRILTGALTVLAAFAGLDIHAAASPGSCMAKAVSASIGNSYSVTLVDEWDPESDYTEAGNPIGGNTGSGVFWYKVVISKYAACSIWIDGISSAEDSVYMSIETDPNDEKAPWASFTLGELEDGTQYGILPSDGWDAEDPSSGTYYIHIDGEIGDSMTLHIESGVKDFSLVGSGIPAATSIPRSLRQATHTSSMRLAALAALRAVCTFTTRMASPTRTLTTRTTIVTTTTRASSCLLKEDGT